MTPQTPYQRDVVIDFINWIYCHPRCDCKNHRTCLFLRHHLSSWLCKTFVVRPWLSVLVEPYQRSLLPTRYQTSIYISGYHPQTNGQTERIHRIISATLKIFVSKLQEDWDQYLLTCAFAYRSSKIDGLDFSPFYLIKGREPKVPEDILFGSPANLPKITINMPLTWPNVWRPLLSILKLDSGKFAGLNVISVTLISIPPFFKRTTLFCFTNPPGRSASLPSFLRTGVVRLRWFDASTASYMFSKTWTLMLVNPCTFNVLRGTYHTPIFLPRTHWNLFNENLIMHLHHP